MRTPPLRHRRKAVLISAVTVIALLAGGIGIAVALRPQHSITVPVLWFGRTADNTPVGGTSSASISTADDGVAGYSVDATSQAAQGAGASWQAASANAAMVATLLSATNPENLSFRFSVDGAIDGPSAGGVLTVGALALLNHHELLPHRAMTGTINPDGTIGQISGLAYKLKGARDAGFTTVVAPTANAMVNDPDSNRAVSTVDYGQQLGVTVVLVSSVTAAYETLTGATLDPATVTSLSPDASVTAAGNAASNTLCTKANTQLDAAPSSTHASVAPELNQAAAALAAGDTETAYGLCAAAYGTIQRDLAEQQLQSSIADSDVATAREQLEVQAEALHARSVQQLTEQSEALADDASIVLNAPQALSRLGTAAARLGAVEAQLASSDTAETLIPLARVIADAQSAIDTFEPLALSIVSASSSGTAASPGLTQFVNSYTTFMAAAGNATVSYLDTLAGSSKLTDSDPDIDLSMVIAQLQLALPATPTASSIPEALVANATALSLWTTSSQLLLNLQSYDLGDGGLGDLSEADGNSAAINASVQLSSTETVNRANQALASGWNPSAALWFAIDGRNTATAIANSAQAAQNALPRLWGAWFSTSMMLAAPTPATP